MASKKPEYSAPAATYYDDAEAAQYTRRTRIATVQKELAERAVELMSMESHQEGGLILDIGCGSGISGDVLTDHGYEWLGVDLSPAMLRVARANEVGGDMILGDIGEELRFRPGCFDGAISVSVVQWLCHAFSSQQDPRKRLKTFFAWLYRSLNHGARAILQFYPANEQQKDMVGKAATGAGFSGGFVVDNPDSEKKRKIFLVLSVGTPVLPTASYTADQDADVKVAVGADGYKNYRSRKHRNEKRLPIKRKDWILAKKEQQRERGAQVRPDTKYTGRRRKAGF